MSLYAFIACAKSEFVFLLLRLLLLLLLPLRRCSKCVLIGALLLHYFPLLHYLLCLRQLLDYPLSETLQRLHQPSKPQAPPPPRQAL
jgi:uncharacterized SAM-binding protein YcdF (DUF218 family)